MTMPGRTLASPFTLWVLLAVPAAPMLAGLAGGPGALEDLIEVSGVASAGLLIAALAVTPLRMMFSGRAWTAWLVRRRRYIGVAAFGYAALHTLFYVLDMGSLNLILDEIGALGIWTGWAALAIFVPLALTSNDWAQRTLKRRWKQLQRAVYAAAVLTAVHWAVVHDEIGDALAWFLPLAALEAYRIWKTRRGRGKALQPQAAD